MDDFFKGLKVVELANVLAGPSVGMFFAELGAEVVKIENSRTAGDMTRHWKLPSEDLTNSTSAYFASINYKKTHLFKDLTQPKELNQVLLLIAEADIVISNFKHDAAQRFNLDGASLCARYPKLIVAHLSGFVSSAEKTAFDVVLQAETGYLSMSGSSDGQAAKMPVALIDVLAAHQLKEGILMALLRRERTGLGGTVNSSLEESALASLVNQASNFLMENTVARRQGTLHPNIAPYGEVVTSRDGIEFALAIGTDKQFARLCNFLSLTQLTTDKLYSTNRSRVINRKALQNMLSEEFKKFDAKEIEEMCTQGAIPIGRIKSIDEVLKSELAQSMIRSEIIDGIETQRLTSIAFKLD